MTKTNNPYRRKLCLFGLAATLGLLAACGGGSDHPLALLYTSISITDLSYPADEYTNHDIRIEARASSIGEISGGDIDWSLEQTYGHSASVVSKEQSDNNHKVIFHVTAPGDTGTIGFRIKVRANDFSDSRSFSVNIN